MQFVENDFLFLNFCLFMIENGEVLGANKSLKLGFYCDDTHSMEKCSQF